VTGREQFETSGCEIRWFAINAQGKHVAARGLFGEAVEATPDPAKRGVEIVSGIDTAASE